MLRPSRISSLARHVQPATMIGFEQIEFFDHTESLRASDSGEQPSLRVLVRIGRIYPTCHGHGAAATCATVNSHGAGLRPGTVGMVGLGLPLPWVVRAELRPGRLQSFKSKV
jgi:hypothetical protein